MTPTAAEMPWPPAFLTEYAKTEWRRLAPKLYDLGLLTHIDRGAFAAYCEAWSTFKQANQEINHAPELVVPVGMKKTITRKKGGEVVETHTVGALTTHPWLWVRNQAMQQMHKFLVEFGLTPMSRSRLDLRTPKTGDDHDWDEF